jgi:hypothetical protein
MRGEETRSVGRHHHHSPRHSTRRDTIVQVHPLSGNIRRGLGWMSYREMNKIKPPTFDGEHKKDEDAETWLAKYEKVFSMKGILQYNIIRRERGKQHHQHLEH